MLLSESVHVGLSFLYHNVALVKIVMVILLKTRT